MLTPGLDLCESEYRKLPPEGDDETIQETLLNFTGESYTQADFLAVPAIDEAEREARLKLARAALDEVTKYEPEWFLDDANYEAVVTMPLRIMRQLQL